MLIAINLFLLAVTPSDTVSLSLIEALEQARQSNPGLQAEWAEARAAAQAPLQASRAFVPTLRFDVQGVRTTDPVAVFGLTGLIKKD